MSPHAEGDVGLCARGDTRVTNTRSRRGGAGLRKDGGNVLSWDGGGGGEGAPMWHGTRGHADTRSGCCPHAVPHHRAGTEPGTGQLRCTSPNKGGGGGLRGGRGGDATSCLESEVPGSVENEQKNKVKEERKRLQVGIRPRHLDCSCGTACVLRDGLRNGGGTGMGAEQG